MQTELMEKRDNYEKVAYDRTDFSVYVRKGALSFYPNYAAISHWHDEVEFIYIRSGQMHYRINGDVIVLHAGEGLFVNTRQIHYGYSPEHQECLFLCMLFHPFLLCSSSFVEQKFIVPVLQNDCFPYFILHESDSNGRNINQILNEIFGLVSSELFALKTQKLLFQLWENLFLLSGHTEKKQVPKNQHLTILKDMIHFISEHYTEKISLADICAVGKVSKTTCSTIFVNYTNQTPFSYLTEYRLKKSTELLLSGDSTVSEICFEVGFSGASYYAETFKKSYHVTPAAYRRLHTCR